MAINPPVDATKTPEWAALQKHYDELQSEGVSLKHRRTLPQAWEK